MNNEREEDDDIDLTTVRRVSSMDSLEQTDSNRSSLRFVSGCRKWINSNDRIRVENTPTFHESIDQQTSSNPMKLPLDIEEDEEISSYTRTDSSSFNHFDVQLQVNNGQPQQAIRYEVFSSITPNEMNTFKTNQSSQTIEPEMDMDDNNNDNRRSDNSRQNQDNQNDRRNSGYRRSQQSNGSSGSGGSADGNGSNPNRNNNNNNARRPGDDDDSEDNDDDDGEEESDENLARRLGFRPIDTETLRIINRLRTLTNRQSFDRRDFDNVQYLIDELIRVQQLENSSQQQLVSLIRAFKLHRILRTRGRALAFIEERLPRRSNRSHQDHSSNVFDLWRERERRSRLDSKDSLEDEGTNTNEQQYREVIEVHHSNPSTNHSNGTSKVKQMARNIDTKSGSSRTRDQDRSVSPVAAPRSRPRDSDNVQYHMYVDDEVRSRRNASPASGAEQRRVRQMIDRLESTSTPTSHSPSFRKSSVKKSWHDEPSNGTTEFSSPARIIPVTRRDDYSTSSVSNGNTGGFVFRHKSPHGDVYIRDNQANGTRFELNRDEIINGGRRIASGTTIDDYVTSLLPGTETSISMVRHVGARLYEDDSAVSRTDVENIPFKVDLETLYILEQKSEKKSLPINVNVHQADVNRSSTSERHDFAMQANIPVTTIKPSNRPIGTQVETSVEQNTVAAQTTDSLHRGLKERPTLFSSDSDEEGEVSKTIRTTTTTTRREVKRRHSTHQTSEDEEDVGGTAVIHFDDHEYSSTEHRPSIEDQREKVIEQSSFIRCVASNSDYEHTRDLDRPIIQQHFEQITYEDDEHRSGEVYEVHTRGACKCLVVSYEEKTQHGPETRFEKQLKRIERTYTHEELKSVELHVIVTSSNGNYQLVRRDYGSHMSRDEEYYDQSKRSAVTIHYYTKDGHRMRSEHGRYLEHLPLFIRCEIEYELNHYGSAQLIILSVTNAERRQMTTSIKKETVDETVTRLGNRFTPNSPELEQEVSRQLTEQVSLLHLVDYSSRDDYNQTSSTDLRRVTRTDVSTSLRLVQQYRTIIHRLCQSHRSHLRLTPQAEQQRHLILVARDEYYLLDLAAQSPHVFSHQRTDFQRREVQHVPHQPFDYAKYRRDMAQQQRILEQHYRQTQRAQPPAQPPGPEFYLGAGRRQLIEREIHSMRESIRPHEHAPPRYKHEPKRRSLSISYSGGQRYVRARIIHVKDYYDESQQKPKDAKEQELFVRVDDYINESAANSLRRSYSTDYLKEDGPRSRIRYIRIPGETIRIEEKTTYEYQGVMYANLPYSLRYWNILNILDREAREGRPLGSSLPHVIVNDPYQTVIPPLTQQEIRQTAQQVLSSQYQPRSYTDNTLRWFLSRDNRMEIESANYLQTLQQCRQQQQMQQQQHHHRQQQQQQHQQKQTNVRVEEGGTTGVAKKYFVTETLVRYEKMPDRLVPVPISDRAQSIGNIHHRSPSNSRQVQQTFHSQNYLNRSQSQPRPQVHPHSTSYTPQSRTPLPHMNIPISRHQSVHELHATSGLSHPPSPSPSLHSLNNTHQYQQQQQQQQHRRPVAFNNRFNPRCPLQQQSNPLLTEIIDSQTGQRILTTSQEQLPTAVRGLLNHYNLQQF